MRVLSLLLSACTLASLCVAQTTPAPATTDEEGCRESRVLPRVKGCSILQCSVKEWDDVEVTIAPTKDDESRTRSVEGPAEVLYYRCPREVPLLQIVSDSETMLTKAGFTIAYLGSTDQDSPIITAQKGNQWLEITTTVDNEFSLYTQTTVLAQTFKGEADDDAGAWEETLKTSGRLVLYGIHFEPNVAQVVPGSEPVLMKLAEILNEKPDWKIRVEVHHDSSVPKELSQGLSQQRSQAVISSLVGYGVRAFRLMPSSVGDSKPLIAAPKDDAERARNFRVELVRVAR